MHLIVNQPFDGYLVGERITDAKLIQSILSDERAAFVLKVAAVDTAPPKK